MSRHTILRTLFTTAALGLLATTVLIGGCKKQQPVSGSGAQPTPAPVQTTAQATSVPRPATTPTTQTQTATISTTHAQYVLPPATLVMYTYDPSNGTSSISDVYRVKQ